MAKIGKALLTQLTSEGVSGPFVTIMLNTHVAHQDIEKDQLKLKNFAKEAKKRFEKRYKDQDWQAIQEKIERILADQSFWRNAEKSAAIILTPTDIFCHRLSITVDDQYYVGDMPYLLAIIKNEQFNYNYYLLALNRDSMKLYQMNNKRLSEVALPKDAPVDIKTALGEEITGGNLNFSSQGGSRSKESVTYHGVNTKDEEVEIDWVNYYQAVDNFLRNDISLEKDTPLYLFALPENQTVFKKIAKNPYYKSEVAIDISPAQLSAKEISMHAEKISGKLTEKEADSYQELLNKKYADQLVDIKQLAQEGRVAQLFIATSNLQDGFGDDPDTEYDHRQVLNTLTEQVIQNGGEVFILEQKDAPGEKSLLAVLRY